MGSKRCFGCLRSNVKLKKCIDHEYCEECFPENEGEKEDIINKPNHYHSDGIDPISIGKAILTKEEMQGFYKMNMIKYWYRAGKKDGNSKEQDLEKYNFYKNELENM